ncbi:TPA: helix-turn-helix domain-containing protein [Providencia stuartii]|nr:helix-turn-helix domain-containing protein [Providencia stuartii]MCR4178849.1 helix-turn-helix domain-containing protein [Providencia vermicola]WIJ75407.1 helix-turn-helix domain-containing protein [Providencia thailandensis]CAK6616184.1 helix-turn-helix domain-containing protein [Providencia stuartii]CAK6617442.1 helix-turn-helix domain-containing protein [Providencia stuartii]CAK6619650.1 helix-turn-helix domain-containing protein [Providencia stuartii]
MSRAATDWAWSLDLKAPQKILILSLADRADEYHCCYPSIQRLVKDTGLDKKTISKWINLMIEDGLISDTGERKGPTKRVRVLRLNIDAEYTQKRDDTEKGNIPKNGSLNVPKNGSLNVPKNGSQNQSLETNNEPKKKGFDAKKESIPDWLDREIWFNWIDYRNEIKKPLKTKKTFELQVKFLLQCLEEGYSPEEIINQSITNGWQGLFKPKNNHQAITSQQGSWNTPEAWRDFI